MSRLAKKPIPVPEGVAVSAAEGRILVKGKGGELALALLPRIGVEVTARGVEVKQENRSAQTRANAGTMWALVRNAIIGVSDGFSKTLEIEGIGYRAELKDATLVMSLGYVNPVRFPVPKGIEVKAEKNIITVSGKDKELVGRVAAEIRALKKPEPYKGKGIRYRGEVIRRKAGKKAVVAAQS